MRCGGCGGEDFQVFTKREDTLGIDGVTNLILECNGCKSTSIVQPFKPVMTIGWGDRSDGIICIMGKED